MTIELKYSGDVGGKVREFQKGKVIMKIIG